MKQYVGVISLIILLLFIYSTVSAESFIPIDGTPRITIPPTTRVPTGALSIESIPTGAMVTIDGITRGTTPFTLRTLTEGPHRIVLEMAGYVDYPATVTITPNQLQNEVYTLTPEHTTTPSPIVTQMMQETTYVPQATLVVEATRTPVPIRTPEQVMYPSPEVTGSISPGIDLVGPITIRPFVIRVGNQARTPVLTTKSPYYRLQIGPREVSGLPDSPGDIEKLPVSFLDVDYYLTQDIMGAITIADWVDSVTFLIARDEKANTKATFRWISAENNAAGFYQVSRYPFPDDPEHWQNQYAPGLVSSGPVKDLEVDEEGFHYFQINMSQIANHKLGDPPFYTGLVSLAETVTGKGTPMRMAKLPFTPVGIYLRETSIGPLTLSLPQSIAFIARDEFIEQDLGNPNENMVLSCSGCLQNVDPTSLEMYIMNMDQTFYIRVVPIRKDGTVGIPTLPVEVTVKRPRPCPPPRPPGSVDNLVVRPPSAQVVSFYMNSFYGQHIQTDQNGKPVTKVHYLVITAPPVINGITISPNQPGYHFSVEPEEEHWYDTVGDIFTGLFMPFSIVVNAVSEAWHDIQGFVVQVVADAIQGLTFDMIKCGESDDCKDVLSTGLSIAMTAYGVPPTIPNFAELENLGTDYMAKVAAEEIGAGGILDTAKSVYSTLPDDLKQEIKNNADETSQALAEALAENTAQVTSDAAGSWFIPDPLYYQPHPAIAVVKVSNPNNERTDKMTLNVKDSAGLFKLKSVYVPSLDPGESTTIPVILDEDFSQVYTPECSKTSYTSTCNPICIPCYIDNWWMEASKNPMDTFVVSFQTEKDGYRIDEIGPASSGTVLNKSITIQADEAGHLCPPQNGITYLKYPDGWKMEANGITENLQSLMWWKYQFTEGDKGLLLTG